MSTGGGSTEVARYTPPPKAYSELPEATRQFLADLRPDEVQQLRESMDFIRSVHTLGKFTKWAVVTLVSGFIMGLTLYDRMKNVFGFGGHH